MKKRFLIFALIGTCFTHLSSFAATASSTEDAAKPTALFKRTIVYEGESLDVSIIGTTHNLSLANQPAAFQKEIALLGKINNSFFVEEHHTSTFFWKSIKLWLAMGRLRRANLP